MPRHFPRLASRLLSASALSTLLTALFACGGTPGTDSAAADPDCPRGEVRVVSCGGESEVCVSKPSGSCAAFDGAQSASDNPCNFGNRFSASCISIEPGTTPTIRCACS